MEHISTLNAGVFTSMAKRLNLDVSPYHSAHGYIGNICKNGYAVHLHDSTDVRAFKGVTINKIPSLSINVVRFVDGKRTDEHNIDVWEYSDISKAIAEVKSIVG